MTLEHLKRSNVHLEKGSTRNTYDFHSDRLIQYYRSWLQSRIRSTGPSSGGIVNLKRGWVSKEINHVIRTDLAGFKMKLRRATPQ